MRRAPWPTAAAGVLALLAAACTEQVASTDPSSVTTSLAASTTTVVTQPPETTTTSTIAPTTSTTTTTTTTTTEPPPPTTSCDSVVHIGDGSGAPLFDPVALGGGDLTATARYQAIGVVQVFPDNADRRQITERVDGPSAVEVAQAVRDNGYEGCWVLMVGTEDAAAIAAGSSVTAEQRIVAMMNVIGDDPVLWVDVVSQRTDDAYRNASMLAWNEELDRVIAGYPNARVFEWYDVVQPDWFRSDGLRYTAEGNIERAALTAEALLDAFPRA